MCRLYRFQFARFLKKHNINLIVSFVVSTSSKITSIFYDFFHAPLRISTMVFGSAFLLLAQQVVLLLVMIQYHNSIRDKGNLHRPAIIHPENSAWQHLYVNADDASFLLLLGVSREVFRMLLNILYPHGSVEGAGRQIGWPFSLLPHAELGLFYFSLAVWWTSNICVWYLDLCPVWVHNLWQNCWNWFHVSYGIILLQR